MHYGVNISKTEISWISNHNNEIVYASLIHSVTELINFKKVPLVCCIPVCLVYSFFFYTKGNTKVIIVFIEMICSLLFDLQ